MKNCDIVEELYNEYIKIPSMIPEFMNSAMNQDLQEYGVSKAEWTDIQKAVREKCRLAVLNKELDYHAIPELDVVFSSMQDNTSTGRSTHKWSFAYFHGELNNYYDELGFIPGDLVRCSVDQYKYPNGMFRIEVAGKTAISYTWEDAHSRSSYQDVEGNKYPRRVRRGLIIWLDDDVERHLYAKKCMDEGASGL